MENNYGQMKSHMIFINIFFLLLLCSGGVSVYAQVHYDYKYHITTHEDTLYYRCLEPENLRSKKKHSLVLFLHGAGERGSDNE